MPQRSEPPTHIRAIRLSGWRAIAAAVAGLAILAVVVAFLAVGFLFIAVPALAIASIAYYFGPKRMIRPVQNMGNIGKADAPRNGTIIDGTFKVVPNEAENSTNGQK
jgi:hypothetical protein